jgi:hypothetical protein
MSGTPKPEELLAGTEADAAARTPGKQAGSKEIWVKPEITSFLSISEAQGINCNPLDGTSNCTYT